MPRDLYEMKASDEIMRERRLRRLGHIEPQIDDHQVTNTPAVDKSLVKLTRWAVIYLALLVALHIGGGYINNPGMYEVYIILPYVIAFFAFFMVGISLLRLPKSNEYYYLIEFQNSFGQIRNYSILLLILLGVCITGEIIYILRFSTPDHVQQEMLFVTIEVLVGIGTAGLFHLKKIYATRGINLYGCIRKH